MGENTGIQWTEHTWNPWRGCTKVSPGCKNCYMFSDQRRFGKDPNIVVKTRTWSDPLKWQQAAAAAGRTEMCFTCSWSDWFIEAADEWRPEAWKLVRDTPNIIYQILTKRSDRIADHLPRDWGQGYPNVWLGVSVENQQCCHRIDDLEKIPARVHFLSVEPLLSHLTLGIFALGWLQWVIVGGESGAGARPCNVEWIRWIVGECQTAHVPVFVKQLGAVPHADPRTAAEFMQHWDARGLRRHVTPVPDSKHGVGTLILQDKKGGDADEWPPFLNVRQFPAGVEV